MRSGPSAQRLVGSMKVWMDRYLALQRSTKTPITGRSPGSCLPATQGKDRPILKIVCAPFFEEIRLWLPLSTFFLCSPGLFYGR